MGVHVEWAGVGAFTLTVARPNERMLDDQQIDGGKVGLILGGDDLVIIEGTAEGLIAKLQEGIRLIQQADVSPCCRRCGRDDADNEPMHGRKYCGQCIGEACAEGSGIDVGLPAPTTISRAAAEAALIRHVATCELDERICLVCQLGTQECSECAMCVDDEGFNDGDWVHGTVIVDPGDEHEGRAERRVVTYGCEGYAHPIVRAAALLAQPAAT